MKTKTIICSIILLTLLAGAGYAYYHSLCNQRKEILIGTWLRLKGDDVIDGSDKFFMDEVVPITFDKYGKFGTSESTSDLTGDYLVTYRVSNYTVGLSKIEIDDGTVFDYEINEDNDTIFMEVYSKSDYAGRYFKYSDKTISTFEIDNCISIEEFENYEYVDLE